MGESILEPLGVETTFVDICDLEAVKTAITSKRPGAVLMETVSNPLLRVGDMGRIGEFAKAVGAAMIVDNTFATPVMVRPLEQGASMVVHSLTKYLAGHGDVMGGAIIADEPNDEPLRAISGVVGQRLGPSD